MICKKCGIDEIECWCPRWSEEAQRVIADRAASGDGNPPVNKICTAPICGDCKEPVTDDKFYTEVNPEGGYDRPQLLVCDDCMDSGRWDDWKASHATYQGANGE